jgi:Kef-type K+ transport system membrane component KefB
MGIEQVKGTRYQRCYKGTSKGISYALLAPIFFVSIGLEIDLSNFPVEAVIFTVILLVVAVLTKVIGCGLGAKLSGGLTNVESLRIGVCMVSRGEVGLIIMNVGFQKAVFVDTGYLSASLLLVILATTILTPPLVRWSFGLADEQKIQVQET